MANPDDTPVLTVGGVEWRGWTGLRVTRGCERVPANVTLTATERFPGAADTAVQPFQPCTVSIGATRVLTGYVTRVLPSIEPTGHEVQVLAVSKSTDLVDCAAIFPGMQLMATSALTLAQQLAAPYGVEFIAEGDVGPIIPQFNAMQGETVWDIVERVTRFAGLLAYDQPDGRVMLRQVGTDRHASGFEEGVNVERASVAFEGDQRYSHYKVVISSVDGLQDVADALGAGEGYKFLTTVEDPRTPRFRVHYILAEQTMADPTLAQRRAEWEKQRRFGRSQAVTLTTDTWRDSAGVLWEPNRLARVHLPSLKLEDKLWVIGEVTYLLDSKGTRAELTLMPPEAFALQPTVLTPFDAQVAAALRAAQEGAAQRAVLNDALDTARL